MRGEQSRQLTLSPALSLYLDVIRIALAFGVFVIHAVKIPFGGPLPLEGYMGQEFVVGFFVLSGLLLPLSAVQHVTMKNWACRRFARLMSLVMPGTFLAIALPYLLAALGRTFVPPVPPQASDFVCGAATLAFVNRVWFLHCEPVANPPLWFMGYIAWFAALVAAWHCLDRKTSIAVMVLIAGFAGPQILLALPLFLLGTAVGAVLRLPVPRKIAGLLYGVSVVLGGAWFLSGLLPLSPGNPLNWRFTAPMGETLARNLGYMRYLLTDLVFGGIFAFHLAASGWLLNGELVKRPVYRVAKWLADRTGSLYVLHAPLLLGVHALVTEKPGSGWIMLGLVDASILIGCLMLGGWMLKLESGLRNALIRTCGGAEACALNSAGGMTPRRGRT